MKPKGFVFEGEALEHYKTLRNKWIKLTIISCILPLVLTCFISWYNGKIDLFNLFGQGEIILSLFSLTVPMMFDLFEAKKSEDHHLNTAFFICVIIVILQIAFYCLIRIDASKYHLIKGFWASLPFIIMSWLCCIYSIKALSAYAEKGGNSHE